MLSCLNSGGVNVMSGTILLGVLHQKTWRKISVPCTDSKANCRSIAFDQPANLQCCPVSSMVGHGWEIAFTQLLDIL